MKHHAGIIIGINHYQYFQPLNFAQQDAQQLHQFLVEAGGFTSELCVEMTETSPHMDDRPTYPTRKNLGWMIDNICRHQLRSGDVLWFFFSGYGVTWEGEDYLMPIDGNPNDIPGTGIWMRSLLETLKATPADRVFVLLDANHATGCMNGKGMGQRTAELAQELEMPTVLSCQIDQFSRETASLELGFFTSALLDALRTGCKTLDSLEQYLSSYLPQLSEQNFRPQQNPLWVVYPPATLKEAVLPESNAEENPVAAVPEETQETRTPIISEENQSGSQPLPEVTGDGRNQTEYSTSEPQPLPEVMDNLGQNNPEEDARTDRSEETIPDPTDSEPIAIEETASSPTPSEPISIEETASSPTPSETPMSKKPKNQLKSFLDLDNDRLWIGMVVVGVILILAGGIGLAKLSEYLDKQESATPMSGDNTTEPVNDPTSQDPPQAASHSTKLTAPSNPETFSLSNPEPSPTQVTLPNSDRVVAIENAQASTFLDAIEKARQIRPSDPTYEQAQENIQNWSQVILDIAKVRTVKGNFSDAIAAAKLVPNDAPTIRAEAEQLQGSLTAQLELKNTNQTLLDEADNSVRLGDASSYARAIAKIRQIKEGQPLYSESLARIEWWSMRIWQISSARASKGQMNLAIETAKLVPEDSTVYADAREALNEWEP